MSEANKTIILQSDIPVRVLFSEDAERRYLTVLPVEEGTRKITNAERNNLWYVGERTRISLGDIAFAKVPDVLVDAISATERALAELNRAKEAIENRHGGDAEGIKAWAIREVKALVDSGADLMWAVSRVAEYKSFRDHVTKDELLLAVHPESKIDDPSNPMLGMSYEDCKKLEAAARIAKELVDVGGEDLVDAIQSVCSFPKFRQFKEEQVRAQIDRYPW